MTSPLMRLTDGVAMRGPSERVDDAGATGEEFRGRAVRRPRCRAGRRRSFNGASFRGRPASVSQGAHDADEVAF
jgi:hypothetical protein